MLLKQRNSRQVYFFILIIRERHKFVRALNNRIQYNIMLLIMISLCDGGGKEIKKTF